MMTLGSKRKTWTPIPLGILLVLFGLAVTLPLTSTAQIIPIGCDALAEANLSLSGGMLELNPGEQGSLAIEYEYSVPDAGFSLEPIEIEFYVFGNPAWIEWALSPSNLNVDVEPLEVTREVGSITLTLDVHEDAPEGERVSFTIEGLASEGTCVTSDTGAAYAQLLVTPAGNQTGENDDPPETTESPLPVTLLITGILAMATLAAARRRT